MEHGAEIIVMKILIKIKQCVWNVIINNVAILNY